MQITFTGRNLEVTEALKNYTQEKLHRLEHRNLDIHKVSVIFQVEHITHRVEATLHLKGIDLYASAEAKDMYAAIDELADKLTTQITKYKEKISDHH